MEHGLYVLEGKAVYLLNRDWVEVEAGDFMWLRAFCPQACYAGGPGRFRYLLYKDVNRHVPLSRQFVLIARCGKIFPKTLPRRQPACKVEQRPAGCSAWITSPPGVDRQPCPPPHAGVGDMAVRGRTGAGHDRSPRPAHRSASVVVNGQPAPIAGLPTHTTALDFLRDRGLTGCKEGCAEGECGACSVLVARPGIDSADRVGRDQRLPHPGRGARRPGGRHRRGPGHAGRAAPGAARDGGARRLAVRLLHARVRVQHGRRVLPARSRADTGDEARPATARARPERVRPARAERQPVPLHRLPADPRRGVRARRRRDADAFAARRGAGTGAAGRTRLSTGRSRVRPPGRPRRGAALLRDRPDAVVVAGSTDWGVEVNLRGRRAEYRRRDRPAAGAARARPAPTSTSRSAPRSR